MVAAAVNVKQWREFRRLNLVWNRYVQFRKLADRLMAFECARTKRVLNFFYLTFPVVKFFRLFRQSYLLGKFICSGVSPVRRANSFIASAGRCKPRRTFSI